MINQKRKYEMKSSLKLAISLLIVLSSSLTNATQIKKIPNCTGACVPKETLEKMNIDIMERDELSKQLELCRAEKTDCLDKSSSTTTWFLAGGITGIVASYIISNLLKK